ncbi:hypothetical protein I553_9482 [Mycobacterium xenopi 4042]|uniref:Uncharacterized protein n=1 Tax=Mycobacterium xenopi 4042 TaxID=1299334 RepID=X8DZE2_MYCXE|nr:hypothetical protein I553_9482 [Mycobacterium xenopi 4042]
MNWQFIAGYGGPGLDKVRDVGPARTWREYSMAAMKPGPETVLWKRPRRGAAS